MGEAPFRVPASWTSRSSSKFFRLSHLRRLRDTEQVAAVCYRIGKNGIEFLLVRTRSGRWTFPKGSTEPGLTHAQAAALEAFEEAGVHGRIEEASFTRYVRRRGSKRRVTVNAHLCEVTRLDSPQEANRDRTWFSIERAKKSLRENRSSPDGAELARVVDRAVRRVEQQHSPPRIIDALQKVTFIDDARMSNGTAVQLSRQPLKL